MIKKVTSVNGTHFRTVNTIINEINIDTEWATVAFNKLHNSISKKLIPPIHTIPNKPDSNV